MAILHPDWPAAPACIVAISTLRSGGASLPPYDDGAGAGGSNLGAHVGDDPLHVQENRRQLGSLLPAEPAWLTQVHGTTVVDAFDVNAMTTADASIATRPGVVCAILTADCLPVLLCDAAGKVVGAAHAGWRGLVGGVLQKTVAAMGSAGATDILAWLGPAIGAQRFEVGAEVRSAFIDGNPAADAAFIPILEHPGKYLADIYLLARLALASAGVDRVSGGAYCTVTQSERFFSFRRDGRTGRMASLIWIK